MEKYIKQSTAISIIPNFFNAENSPKIWSKNIGQKSNNIFRSKHNRLQYVLWLILAAYKSSFFKNVFFAKIICKDEHTKGEKWRDFTKVEVRFTTKKTCNKKLQITISFQIQLDAAALPS